MPCSRCASIANSYDGEPFRCENKECYICPSCGQKWWCYNNYYALWTTVDDDDTWNNIQDGCPQPVIIGSPAVNLYKVHQQK